MMPVLAAGDALHSLFLTSRSPSLYAGDRGNTSSSHEYFMGLALEEALKAHASGEVPVGAVIVDPRGEILGRAFNAPISLVDPTAHAEILALRQAAIGLNNYRLAGATLYVTMEPCAMCLGAMLHARIETLVFGAGDIKGGAAGGVVDLTNVPSFNHYVRVIKGIREEECAGLLRQFFQERRQARKQEVAGEVPKRP